MCYIEDDAARWIEHQDTHCQQCGELIEVDRTLNKDGICSHCESENQKENEF